MMNIRQFMLLSSIFFTQHISTMQSTHNPRKRSLDTATTSTAQRVQIVSPSLVARRQVFARLDQPTSCPFCQQEESSTQNLAIHLRSLCNEAPPEVQQTPYLCPICLEKETLRCFPTYQALAGHLKVHYRQPQECPTYRRFYLCPDCPEYAQATTATIDDICDTPPDLATVYSRAQESYDV